MLHDYDLLRVTWNLSIQHNGHINPLLHCTSQGQPKDHHSYLQASQKQSVLESMPIYYLSLFKVPASVAKTIEKFLRNFLWEGFGEGKGDHLVCWDKVSRSKRTGGLGIGQLIKRNEALLGKWLWRFAGEREAFWHKIIESKYGLHDNGWDAKRGVRGTYRNPWRAISGGIDEFQKHIRFKVGNGSRIRFWGDLWMGDRELKYQFPRLFRVVDDNNATIENYIIWGVNDNYGWDITFRRNFTEEEENDYMDLLGRINNWELARNGADSRIWKGDVSGIFSVKSFFETISSSDEDRIFEPCSMIWKTSIPTKVRVLAWLAALRKVNTADSLQVRRPFQMVSPSWCIMCKGSNESLDHLLIHCAFAHSIWSNVRREFNLISAFPSSWYVLLIGKWCLRGNKKKSNVLWRCSCMAVLWCIWKERNARIFDDKEENEEKVWQRVKSLASLWAFSSKKFGILSMSDILRDWEAAMA